MAGLRHSNAHSGSTKKSAMFWTSRTSHSPRRISSGELSAARAALVGSNSSTWPNLARHPTVNDQFSLLVSWTIAEPDQVNSVGTTRPTPYRIVSARNTAHAPGHRGADFGLAIGRAALKAALSHQPFLLGCTYLLAEVGFNKVNGWENQLRTAREPLLARCDGVDDARAASGSMKGQCQNGCR
jgi:hypothetical protein